MTLPPKPWPVGKPESIAPLVQRVLAPNPSPYTFTGTQSYIIGDSGDVAIIDPGPDDPAHIDALVAAIGDAHLAAIMCTHTHRDHSPGAAPLAKATGAPIVGCAPLRIASTHPRVDAAYDQGYSPDRVLEDGEMMTGTGWTLEAIATPGHISNHLCYALHETGALFSGDHVMGWSTTVIVPPDGDMGDYMTSLEKLYGREDAPYFPAHGPPVERPRQLLRGTIGHRRQREAQILRLLGKGPQTIIDLVGAMYKGIDPRLEGGAAMSVKAHLLALEKQGAVKGDQFAEDPFSPEDMEGLWELS